jgi:uncharacterized protein
VLTLWRLGALVGVVVVALVLVGLPLLAVLLDGNVPGWLPILGAVVALALAAGQWWYTGRRFRSWRIDFTADALQIHRGLLWQQSTAVPYHRIQQIDIEQGPLQRRFDLVSLRLRTASAGSDGHVPGLSRDDAESLRTTLLQRSDRDDGA